MRNSTVITTWSDNLAYAVGLIVTDGSLSIDARHIDVSSKDKEQLTNFLRCVNKDIKIGTKKSGSGDLCYRVQFSDVRFYRFLLNIGLTPHKSKTVGPISIPDLYFFDFLRGHFDGDGSFYSYMDNRWKNSLMYYVCFTSASVDHIKWLRASLNRLLSIKGHITYPEASSTYQLKYAKKESVSLINKMYYNKHVVSLSRKKLKIASVMGSKTI